ncbi:hypothetical protein HR060_10105 [Catenovulum sp. SM1970]|uniref:hypothetical protein n=1 Tax=Marinifaba aquimaris TaxID=2741323 RepID=UPI00157335C5|nr:hypothetical protein [Marinifaba aquimaris]NTS77215.1 hypothetical protein [Marinifaba aquimaris]
MYISRPRKINTENAASVPTVPLIEVAALGIDAKLRLLNYCLAINELAGLKNDFALIERDLFFVVKINHPVALKQKLSVQDDYIADHSGLMFSRIAPVRALISEQFTLRRVGNEIHPDISTNIVSRDNLLSNIDSYFPLNNKNEVFTGFAVKDATIDEF